MKAYKFKLEALLKIRKLKEEKCKMEIGKLQVEIKSLENKIAKYANYISQVFDEQEAALEDGATGQEVSIYPYIVTGNRATIENTQIQIDELKEKVNQLFTELNAYRADVKVIEKMKENDMKNIKKERIKKEFENLEEQVQNWKSYLG